MKNSTNTQKPVSACTAAGLALILYLPGLPAAATGKPPLIIGITTDKTGNYADSGASERRGIMMAIKEFNLAGGVLSRAIKTVAMDTATDVENARAVAIKLMEQHNAGFLIGGVHSGLAAAISSEAQAGG